MVAESLCNIWVSALYKSSYLKKLHSKQENKEYV